MPKLLVLNHHGASVPALIKALNETGATLKIIEAAEVKASSATGFDGVVASGGYLSIKTYRQELQVYSQILNELDRPYLGVCLGLKILGHHYGARMRKTEPAMGIYHVRFLREYPLAVGLRECSVYQGHKYELIPPLPEMMENYATNGSPVQAIKISGLERYGVQFHPELSGEPAAGMIRSFVSRC